MPSYFIPARSSRHRTACFALYRALLRQVPQISLPPEIATGWGKINPLTHYIRTGFRRNKADTSPRLVTAALRNGYRFLALLAAAARSPSSPEHASVLSYLEGRLAKYRQNLATYPPPPPPPTNAPHPNTVPIVRRLPGAAFAYEATVRPRPLAELAGSGVRRVPVMYRANEIPFLRLGKPQPPALSRVLRDKLTKRQARLTLTQTLLEDSLVDAKDEDTWEREVAALAAREGKRLRDLGDRDAKYGDSVILGYEYVIDKLNEERDDMIARGNALLEIVEREAELAEIEERERARKANYIKPAQEQ